MRRALLVLPTLVLALAAAGCGGDAGGPGGTDPASFVPASAPIYGEIVVRPDGDQADELRAAASKVLGESDPGGAVQRLLDDALGSDGKDVTFARDIEPWLGERAGFAVLSLRDGAASDAVVVIDSTDAAKATAALAKTEPATEQREHGGVAYRYDAGDEDAYAVLDGAVVAGTESGVKAAIDASKADALDDADGLEQVRDELDDERLGLVYVETSALTRALAGSGAPQAPSMLPLLAGSLPQRLGLGIDVDDDVIELDAVAIGAPRASAAKGSSDAIEALPASAWLAFGTSDLGSTLDESLRQMSSGLAQQGVDGFIAQLQAQFGIDLRKDVLDWMGDAGIYVAGSAQADLHGAVVVETSDTAATDRALAKLETLINAAGAQVRRIDQDGVDLGFGFAPPGAPPIAVARAGERFVIAVGEGALREAIADEDRLGDDDAFQGARDQLGDGVEPSLYVSVDRVTRLLEGAAGGDPGFASAKRYLDAFSAIVAGSGDDQDGVVKARVVATLR